MEPVYMWEDVSARVDGAGKSVCRLPGGLELWTHETGWQSHIIVTLHNSAGVIDKSILDWPTTRRQAQLVEGPAMVRRYVSKLRETISALDVGGYLKEVTGV